MKLLDKKTLVVEKSNERAKEVQEGLKLAKSIDSLRETHSKEESNLKKFRDESLKSIKSEIDLLNEQKNRIKNDPEIVAREKMKQQLLSEIQVEQRRINDEKKANEILRRSLLATESDLISRESTLQASNLELFEREEKIKENKATSERYLIEAKKKFNESEIIRVETEKFSLEKEKEIDQKIKELKQQKEDLLYKERDVKLKEDQIEKEKLDILNEKIHIESQQQTLRVAWENIKKLQVNNK